MTAPTPLDLGELSAIRAIVSNSPAPGGKRLTARLDEHLVHARAQQPTADAAGGATDASSPRTNLHHASDPASASATAYPTQGDMR